MFFIATDDEVSTSKPDDPSYEKLSCAYEELLLDFEKLVTKITNLKNKKFNFDQRNWKIIKRKSRDKKSNRWEQTSKRKGSWLNTNCSQIHFGKEKFWHDD